MAPYELKMDEHIAIVTMNNGENRFTNETLDAFLAVLDEVENNTDARVLLVTSAHEKIFSNGIDLDWLVPHIQENGREAGRDFVLKLTGLFKRILMMPMITVAAINGHVFAGGAIMASAFDFRFMRTERGFFCVPEVDIGIPFMPSMTALMLKAAPTHKFWEMQFTGKRLTAEECEEHHIILKACPIENLMDEALAFARANKKERGIIKTMKNVTNKEMLRIFAEDDPAYLNSAETGLI